MTNELLRDVIEPAWTLFTFYVVFIAYIIEFGIIVSWASWAESTSTKLVTWIVQTILFVLSHYLFLYTVNAESCPIKTFREGKNWLERQKHNFHAFLWNVFTLQT